MVHDAASMALESARCRELERDRDECRRALQIAHENAQQHGQQAAAIVSSLKIVCELAQAVLDEAPLPPPRVGEAPLRCSDIEVLEQNLLEIGRDLEALRHGVERKESPESKKKVARLEREKEELQKELKAVEDRVERMIPTSVDVDTDGPAATGSPSIPWY